MYQAVDPDGEPAPELVVTDADGKELRRIDLPAEVSLLFPFQFPLNGHVLYEDTLGTEQWFLVDIGSGESQELGNLGLGQDDARPCVFSSYPVLLCGEQGVYLLDVEAGKILDTPIELDPNSPARPWVEWVSPDEAYFLVRLSDGLWLVPAATPEAARRLGPAEEARGATLSDDGASIVYTERTDEGETQVVKERVDGSDSEILLSGPEIEQAVWMPKQDQLIIVRREQVSLYSLADQEEHKLSEPANRVRTVWVDPEAKKAILDAGGFKVEEVEWLYVDLEAKTSKKLDELNGYHRFFESPGSTLTRWLFLTDELVNGTDEHIASLDLQTGEVRTHISIENAIAFNFIGLTRDGRVGLVYAATESGRMELWLLVAERDEAVLLAASFAVSGSLSADGEWVVLGERQGNDAQSMAIKLIATDSGEEKVIGEGFFGVWVEP